MPQIRLYDFRYINFNLAPKAIETAAELPLIRDMGTLVKLQTVINNKLFVLLLQITARLAVICVVAAN